MSNTKPELQQRFDLMRDEYKEMKGRYIGLFQRYLEVLLLLQTIHNDIETAIDHTKIREDILSAFRDASVHHELKVDVSDGVATLKSRREGELIELYPKTTQLS